MKKLLYRGTATFFVLLVPFLAVTPSLLFAILATDTDDTDPSSALELRAYSPFGKRTTIQNEYDPPFDFTLPVGDSVPPSLFTFVDLQPGKWGFFSEPLLNHKQIRAPPTQLT